jgi:hypothetical protein
MSKDLSSPNKENEVKRHHCDGRTWIHPHTRYCSLPAERLGVLICQHLNFQALISFHKNSIVSVITHGYLRLEAHEAAWFTH